MIIQSKTVSLSNSYPTGGDVEIPFAFSVESGTKMIFDLQSIVNDKNSDKLGLYKIFFDFGDGNSEYYNLEFDFLTSNYIKPTNITHSYFLTAANSPSRGEARFFYKNGNTTLITLSVYSSLNNNIDLGLITTTNNSFVSLSADTLLGFIDNDNDFYNNIIRNSVIEKLILNIPTVVRALTTINLVTTPGSPPYAGTTQVIPFCATEPLPVSFSNTITSNSLLSAAELSALRSGNVIENRYHAFDLHVTQCIDFLLYPDGTITNVEIVPCLPELPPSEDVDFTSGQIDEADTSDIPQDEEQVNEEEEKEEEFLFTVLTTDDGVNILTDLDDFIIIFD
jgi:hypothetical protein|tara:strand:- start:648 stop:1658 length:1011 start_codon:yes stop_codon:yes gene_type:complete